MQVMSGNLDMSVLICSSSSSLRQSLEALLKAMGCRLTSGVATNQQAIDQVSVQHFDIAIIDESFVHDEALAKLPKIELNSGSAEGQAVRKPFRPAELAERLVNAINTPMDRAAITAAATS